ncbi:hypothetical protein FE257_004255 [Aspergillus nanangensis]|uniref:Amidohydrolase-related domain-containing protein n=1 Tax=Aspergillus nanangensis TaxID=2582783 RepID=A0AAD4CRK1_ASPNN|nr:hypothetical protein FE257_004255 [Aspergillus nanangensis]
MPSITALTNVRVFDGDQILPPSTVILNGATIGTPDQTPTTTIDGQGAVLLPGLIDCHIHLKGPEELTVMAQHGVTTALDMGTWPPSLLQSLRNQKGVTDIRACGLPATAPGSTHSHIPTLPREALVANAAGAETFVAARIAEAADYIKVVADVPGPDQETLDALEVVAHAVTLVATRMAQAAGADYITHAPLDGVMSREEVEQMVAEKRVSIPTLVMMKGVAQKLGKDFGGACKTVSALHDAGVPILVGTDANDAPGVPAMFPHGVSLHEEMELLVACGLSTKEVLRAATSMPAKYFGLQDRGVIQPGYRADLVLVGGDPVEDIRATRQIQRVWIEGQEIALS